MRPDVLHLTLVFIGQVESARVPGMTAGLSDVAQRHAAYATNIEGAGGHIDDRRNAGRGGVAWLTLGHGFHETAALALDADSALRTHIYDERRRPRPHLTVARALDAPALAALHDLALSLRIEWRTSDLVLFRSHLGPGGSRYEPIARQALFRRGD